MASKPRRTTAARRLLTRAGPLPFLLLAAALVPPPDGGGSLFGLPPLCPFRWLTGGLPCPGCGITRSLVCCGHGRLAEAFGFHPLGPAVFVGLALAAAGRWLPPGRAPVAPARTMNQLWGAALAVVLVVWAIRLAGWLPLP